MSPSSILPTSPEAGWRVKRHPAVTKDAVVGCVFRRAEELSCFASLIRNLHGWPPGEAALRRLAADLEIVPVSCEGCDFHMIQFEGEADLPKGLRVYVWFDELRGVVWLLHVATAFPPSIMGSVRRRAVERLHDVRGFLHDEGKTSP